MTKRWVNETRTNEETPEIDAFIREITAVCQRHGLSISHEDGHGAFEIATFDRANVEWLEAAHDARRIGRSAR